MLTDADYITRNYATHGDTEALVERIAIKLADLGQYSEVDIERIRQETLKEYYDNRFKHD